LEEIRPYINWNQFYHLWGVRKGTAEAETIRREAEILLDTMETKHHLCARIGFFPAYGTEVGIVMGETFIPTPRQNQPNEEGYCLSLCDFVAPEGENDYVGTFAITISSSFVQELETLKEHGEPYESLLMQSVGDRLVEAASEWLHKQVRQTLWGYAPQEQLDVTDLYKAKYQGIRPAVGYPSLPDQKVIFTLDKLLDLSSIDISLTENGAMYPQSSVCGLYIANRHSRYFVI
jgi:5-methyltetrahydrofolate--homocysteine methyltransferase